MKSIVVTQGPAGWAVQSGLSDLPWWFLSGTQAERSAYAWLG